jgi:hypothetical protein
MQTVMVESPCYTEKKIQVPFILIVMIVIPESSLILETTPYDKLKTFSEILLLEEWYGHITFYQF